MLLLLTSAEARADGPWVITLGAGPELNREVFVFTATGNDFRLGASARLDAGYHFATAHASVANGAIGVHLGIAYIQTRPFIDGPVVGPTVIPLEAGLGAQLVLADRVLIAPWAGLVDLSQYRFYAYGIELGYDVLVRGRDRLCAVATFTRAPGNNGVSYTSIGAGVAYRYW